MSKVLEFHKSGFNCAESIIKAANEEKNIKIPVALASPFGAGMTVGSTCGAITAALMVLGSVKGRESISEANNSRKETKEFMTQVKEKYGTFECIELKKHGVSCGEIIEYAYELINTHI